MGNEWARFFFFFFFLFGVPCNILIFLRGSANEKPKPVFFFFFIFLGPISKISEKLVPCVF